MLQYAVKSKKLTKVPRTICAVLLENELGSYTEHLGESFSFYGDFACRTRFFLHAKPRRYNMLLSLLTEKNKFQIRIIFCRSEMFVNLKWFCADFGMQSSWNKHNKTCTKNRVCKTFAQYCILTLTVFKFLTIVVHSILCIF